LIFLPVASIFDVVKIMTADAEDFLLLGCGPEGRRCHGLPRGKVGSRGSGPLPLRAPSPRPDREAGPADGPQHVVMVSDPVADDVDDLTLLL